MNSMPDGARRITPGSLYQLAASFPMLRQAGLLFTIEIISHGLDYVFHIYVGRTLAPGSFAAFQSYSALAMLFITLSGVLQPAVARYTAAPPETARGQASPGAILRTYLWQSVAVGILIGVIFYLVAPVVSRATLLPVAMLHLIAFMMPAAMARPTLLGLFQGQTRFGSYGGITLLYAVARLTLVVAGLSVGGLATSSSGAGGAGDPAAYWAAQTIPFSMVLAVALGLILARRELREPGSLPWEASIEGWQLSLVALMIAAAFTALTGLDVVWINRISHSDVAGAYARALVLRRVVQFVPVVAGVVLLPRVASAYRDGRIAARPIAVGVGVVLANGVLLTILYALVGGAIDRLAFGVGQEPPTTWLVGMALAMTGYGLVTVWINVFVATKPLPYGYMLLAAAPLQVGLFLWLGRSPEAVVTILAISGWLLALAGGALYLLWLKPRVDTRTVSE
jgi:O-antigen/teichoic acid export membrane protein